MISISAISLTVIAHLISCLQGAQLAGQVPRMPPCMLELISIWRCCQVHRHPWWRHNTHSNIIPQSENDINVYLYPTEASDKQNTGDRSGEVSGFSPGARGKPRLAECGGYAAITGPVSWCHLIVSNEENMMAVSPFTLLPSHPTSVQSDRVVWPVR